MALKSLKQVTSIYAWGGEVPSSETVENVVKRRRKKSRVFSPKTVIPATKKQGEKQKKWGGKFFYPRAANSDPILTSKVPVFYKVIFFFYVSSASPICFHVCRAVASRAGLARR